MFSGRERVRDNYARFYLETVEPRSAAIKSGLFSTSVPDGRHFDLIVPADRML